MERVKRAVRSLMAVLLIVLMLTTVAFAAENGSLWVKMTSTSEENGVAALIVADTTVTDGVIELTYDSAKLTYKATEADEKYVAQFAVNAENPGVVKISWVAPEAYETDGESFALICVQFTGKADATVTLFGHVSAPDGSAVAVTQTPDTTELEKAIKKAEKLKESQYTPETFAELKAALENAKAVLEDPLSSQTRIDEATKALNDAIAGLKKPTGGNAATGDGFRMGLTLTLLAVSAAGLGCLYIFHRRRSAR